MFCKEYENEAILYLYDELDAEASRKFESHINDCSVCKMALSQFKDARDAYRKLEPEIPSIWMLFLVKLKSRIFAYSTKLKKLRSKFLEPKKIWIPVAVSSAALILICLSLFGIFNNKTSQFVMQDEILDWTIVSDDSISTLDQQIDEIFTENLPIKNAEILDKSIRFLSDEDLGLTKIQQDIIFLSWDINQSYF